MCINPQAAAQQKAISEWTYLGHYQSSDICQLCLTFAPGIPGIPSRPSTPGKPLKEQTTDKKINWLLERCYLSTMIYKLSRQMKKMKYTYRLSFRPRETIYSSCTLRALWRRRRILKNENKHIGVTDAKNVIIYSFTFALLQEYQLCCMLIHHK